MPTDPALEKVAALAARPRTETGKRHAEELRDMRGWDGEPAFDPDSIDSTIVAIETEAAAGYDVARIEEGERLRAALRGLRATVNDCAWGLRNQPHHSREDIAGVLERAALAASDEAVRP